MGMSEVLAEGRPREILAKVAESLVAYRWPTMLDWDRNGFIDVQGPRPGFVTRGVGSIDLAADGPPRSRGAPGASSRGVRMTLVPDLAIDELDRCDVAAAVTGGPSGCEPQREYGWLALRNIAARLRPSQLPAGARLFELAPERAASLEPLAVPGAMHLCTLSHESTTQGGARLYHHMMIVLATDDAEALEVFDTTGIRGVALTRMTRGRFLHYCGKLLAASREYRYSSASARLTCLPVAAVRDESPGQAASGPSALAAKVENHRWLAMCNRRPPMSLRLLWILPLGLLLPAAARAGEPVDPCTADDCPCTGDDCPDATPSPGTKPHTCNGRGATIVGTNAGETIFGTPGDDVIVALGGNDIIHPGDGDDVVCAGDGDDKVYEQQTQPTYGNDWISGGNGNDLLYAAYGDDTVYGDAGNDHIVADVHFGAFYNDICYGGPGDDIIYGRAGNDWLLGDAGDDKLYGEDGDDLLWGG
jgi:hypothetical protein